MDNQDSDEPDLTIGGIEITACDDGYVQFCTVKDGYKGTFNVMTLDFEHIPELINFLKTIGY